MKAMLPTPVKPTIGAPQLMANASALGGGWL